MEEWLKKNKSRLIFVTLLISNILIWSFYFSLPDGKLHIKAYDVGQGDSIFIKTASGKTVLIDGGPDNRVLEYLGQDIPFYSKSLDLVILTHPEADHLSGLLEVARQYKIGSLWINGGRKDTRLFRDWEELIARSGLKTRVVDQGDKLVFPDSTQVRVLWPKDDLSSTEPNLGSIVVTVSYGSFDGIFAGDAEKEVQPYTSGQNHVELLKVPHHGAKNALDPGFVRTISPEVSFISVGRDNRYGHPARVTIDILSKIGSEVYRTDKNGTLEIVSDGESWYTLSDNK